VAGAGLLLLQSIALIAGTWNSAQGSTQGSTLGCADSFAILSSSGVSNKGWSNIYGNLGVKPGAAITGFPPGVVFAGSIYFGGPVVREARLDAFALYDRLMRLPSFPIASATEGNLGGLKLLPGVYSLDTARLKGTLRLDARGADNGVFVFQIETTLTTAPDAAVVLLNSGRGDAVYWQVGGSAKLGRGTSFYGNILAHKDIALDTGARIRCGGAFTLTGAVTLDRNYISIACDGLETPIPGSGAGFIPTGLNQSGLNQGRVTSTEPGRVGSSPEPGTFWLAAACLAAGIAVRFLHRPLRPR